MAGKNKQNPLLASFEAKLEARYSAQLDINAEIDLIAHMISCNEDLKVGPGRAEKVLNGFLESKMDVMTAIVEDEDKELVYTKHQIAQRLKQIMGPENWKKYHTYFPLLKEYWDD